jgi:hypothetical protein
LICAVTVGMSPALASAAAGHERKSATPRVGGRVHRAWPRGGDNPPRSPLARWLARQVGPTTLRPCTRRLHGRVVRCHRKHPRRTGVPLPGAELGAPTAHTAGADPGVMQLGEDLNPIAYAAGSAPATETAATDTTNLRLVRSYAIPTDDPSYARLLNWSWTYDSAITAAAFTVFGATSEAQQLLDQLAALQHSDGSIEIAFNVADGTTEPAFRSGTIATVGLAGSLYDQRNKSNRYLSMEERAATYLIALQGTNGTGLVRGGPDVGWYSTQHNLLAYAFLTQLGNELTADGQRPTANTYLNAANKISSGLESKLLVQNGSQAWFIEGLGDNVQSLDADALGALYLASRNETTNAQKVLAYTKSAFAIAGRSIVRSTSTGTYNNTYAATGPFSGFKPFIGAGARDVMWTEGSAEMVLADLTVGQSSTAVDSSLRAIAALTPASGPLMADRTVTNPAYSAEFHVWPSAAAGAWLVLASAHPTLFASYPGGPPAEARAALGREHFVGDRERDLEALAHRRLQHELPGGVGPSPPRAQPVDGQRDRVGKVAGVAGPAARHARDGAAEPLRRARQEVPGDRGGVHPRPFALHPRLQGDAVDLVAHRRLHRVKGRQTPGAQIEDELARGGHDVEGVTRAHHRGDDAELVGSVRVVP